MRAWFNNLAFLQDKYFICFPNSQAMSNNDGRPVSHKTICACCTRYSDSVSNELVASSKIKISGFLRVALSMAILCLWPPDSLTPYELPLPSHLPAQNNIPV